MKIMLIELIDARGVTIDSCSVNIPKGTDAQPLIDAAMLNFTAGLLRNTGSVLRISEYMG